MGQPDKNEGTKEDLVRYRIQKAKDDLKSAKILLNADEFIRMVEEYVEKKFTK